MGEGTFVLYLTPGGNLVEYDAEGAVFWSTDTSGDVDYLTLTDVGQWQIKAKDGSTIWSSGWKEHLQSQIKTLWLITKILVKGEMVLFHLILVVWLIRTFTIPNQNSQINTPIVEIKKKYTPRAESHEMKIFLNFGENGIFEINRQYYVKRSNLLTCYRDSLL